MTSIATPWSDSSWDVLERTRAIVNDTQCRIAQSRRLLNPWWTLSGGSDGVDDSGLRRSVRARLERGDLIAEPNGVRGAGGVGTICIICTRAILDGERQNKVVIRSRGVIIRLWVHLPCLTIWREESEVFTQRTHFGEDPAAGPPPAFSV